MKIEITKTIKAEIDVPSPCRIGFAYVANIGGDPDKWVWVYGDSIILAPVREDEARKAVPISTQQFNEAWDRTMNKLDKISFDF